MKDLKEVIMKVSPIKIHGIGMIGKIPWARLVRFVGQDSLCKIGGFGKICVFGKIWQDWQDRWARSARFPRQDWQDSLGRIEEIPWVSLADPARFADLAISARFPGMIGKIL